MNPELAARYGTDDPDRIDAILAAQDGRRPVEVPAPEPELERPRPAMYPIDEDARARREFAELWPWQRIGQPKPRGWPTWHDRWYPTGQMYS